MKKTLNEYDMTKTMLGKIRNIKNLTEQEENGYSEKNLSDKSVVTNINGVDVTLKFEDNMDSDMTEDTKNNISNVIDNFKEQVSDGVLLEPGFMITPDTIRLDGSIIEFNVGFILITGSKNGTFLKITESKMVELSPDFIDFIRKLNEFGKIFKDAFNDIITNRELN
jgi:hypothetical protein